MDARQIKWDDALVIGNTTVDKQHKHLFEVFERLRDLTSSQGKLEQVAVCISEMMRYLKTHFADEEAHMLSIGYADLEKHKAQHAAFVDKVNDYAYACGSGYAPYADLLEYLVTWLTEHIMVEDMAYIQK